MNMYFAILWRNTNWLLEAQIVLKLKTIKNKLQSANSAILKISKSQKEILVSSILPKTQRKYFHNFYLAYKRGQIKKYRHFNILIEGYLA